jgi:ABC-type multidrug transport system permease subunit
MDDPGLRDRVSRMERRQRLLLAALIVPNYVAAGELLGYWTVSLVAAGVAVLALVSFVVASRRRGGNPTGDTT